MNPIVFVGGVHGAGKTSLSALLARLLSASHATAGTLIRQAKVDGEGAPANGLRKEVANVDRNQALLLDGLEHYRQTVIGPILLDGHFALLTPDGAVVDVPLAVFEAIAPAAVLLVEADEAVVHQRLLNRDGAAPAISTLSLLGQRERTRATAVSARLGIPICSARGDADPALEADQAALRLAQLLSGVE